MNNQPPELKPPSEWDDFFDWVNDMLGKIIIGGFIAYVFWIGGSKIARESQDPLSFYGYDCTEDCSGHEAGYEWAEEKNITNEDECGGYSQSFIEGCWAYVENN